MNALKFLVHRREESYCAKAEPKVICDGLFFLYPLCLYIKVFSTFALERLLRYAEPNAGGELTVVRNDVWGDILIGAIKFYQIDIGE